MSGHGDAVTPSRVVRSRLPDVEIPALSVTDDAFRTAPADADRIAVIDGVDGAVWTRDALLERIRRLAGDRTLQGEHDAEVLGELAYDWTDIERLTATGALVGNAAGA